MRKLAIICGVLCAMATLNAAQYATEVKNLYVDSKDSKVVGKLLPTTEVQVIKKENGRVLLAVEGYADANSNLAVYFVPGKRILSVGLTKDSGIALKKQSSVQADGKTYNKVKIEAWSEDDALSDDINGLLAQAKDMYEQNCSMCHGLHSVKEYTANQWPSMFKSMAGRTAIDKKDYQLVIEYLQKNAKDMK